jgi:hypothetical protein
MFRFSYALIAGLIAASPAAAQKVCLDNQQVESARSDDGKTMIFKMRNGQTYINHMRGSCPGLKYNGFAWELRGINQICENQQTLRVINSGEICMLGKFDPPLPRGAKLPAAR